MTSDNFIRVLAGSFTVLSAALAHFHHPAWLLFTAFIGLNLIQSAFTGFCPPTMLLRKLGWINEQGILTGPARRQEKRA